MSYATPRLTLVGSTESVVLGLRPVEQFPTDSHIQPYDGLTSLESEW